jgi:hypothetical protein
LFLIAYRALSKELYAKRYALRVVPLLRRQDKGRDALHQVRVQSELYLHEQALRLGLRDLESIESRYRAAFLSNDCNGFSAFLLFTDRPPDFVVSGAMHPEFDFQGSALQSLSNPACLDLVTYTVLPLPSGGMVAFVWDSQSAASSQKMVMSLDQLATQDVPDALVRFTYEHFENCYANPDWWDSLSSPQRECLLRRINSAASPAPRKADCLKDDLIRTARWKVNQKEWL